MKESYEDLKMEVIAFDGDIFTDTSDRVIVFSGTPAGQSLVNP